MAKLHFVGPGEYDDIVVEIDFSPAFTAVIGKASGRFFIEVFNFSASQLEDFANGRKRDGNLVDLDEFSRLIEEAKAALQYQKPQDTADQ